MLAACDCEEHGGRSRDSDDARPRAPLRPSRAPWALGAMGGKRCGRRPPRPATGSSGADRVARRWQRSAVHTVFRAAGRWPCHSCARNCSDASRDKNVGHAGHVGPGAHATGGRCSAAPDQWARTDSSSWGQLGSRPSIPRLAKAPSTLRQRFLTLHVRADSSATPPKD
jgi:hypothetical protein